MIRLTATVDDIDRRLMEGIYDRWGSVIWDACLSSSVPPEFLAAVIANESAGESDKVQFCSQVHRSLLAVRSGERTHYAALTGRDLQGLDGNRLSEYATAWGLTQIMGYQVVLEREMPRRLLDATFNCRKALRLFAAFSERYMIDVRAEFEDLLRCWSTGRPDGVPTDAAYVENGMHRLAIYREFLRLGPVPTAATVAAGEVQPQLA